MRYLEDLALGRRFSCGSFRLTREEAILFATRYEPLPFHIGADTSHKADFGPVRVSGLLTQAKAIGLMVRAIADVAIVTTLSLHEARFLQPVWSGKPFWPESEYSVTAAWTSIGPSPGRPTLGRAGIAGAVVIGRKLVATLGVTYDVARRPT